MISRRGFLKAGGLALFGIGLGGIPGFLADAVASTVTPSLFKKRKILVCIFQRGAMDGLMAVTPFTDQHLKAARPSLFMSAAQGGKNKSLIDLDGKFGTAPIVVDPKGLVASAPYSSPNSNYSTAASIIISAQPSVSPTCELQNVTIELTDNGGSNYQWQISTDGTNWANLTNNATYSNVTTNKLTINQVHHSMNGYQYRVELTKTGNSCGLKSDAATLTVYALPILLASVDLKQCDTDSDGISDFNLTEKNNYISANAATETFTYYTSSTGAETNDVSTLIINPTAYTTNSKKIWVRAENSNNCFSVSEINLIVSSTQIPSTFKKQFETCDDEINTISSDIDGISEFDFSNTTSEIEALLIGPLSQYTINYYRNEADALAEVNPITNSSNYRNIGYPNSQDIWIVPASMRPLCL